MLRTAIPVLALLALAPAPVLAQSQSQRGAAEGADTGAAVLGPVGAIVGGVTGAAVGGAADIANAVTPVPPTTVKHTTCVTDAAGNKRCDSVETTN